MKKINQIFPEVRERAVRMVTESHGDASWKGERKNTQQRFRRKASCSGTTTEGSQYMSKRHSEKGRNKRDVLHMIASSNMLRVGFSTMLLPLTTGKALYYFDSSGDYC